MCLRLKSFGVIEGLEIAFLFLNDIRNSNSSSRIKLGSSGFPVIV